MNLTKQYGSEESCTANVGVSNLSAESVRFNSCTESALFENLGNRIVSAYSGTVRLCR
jgi:hypothetical protein